MLPAENQIIRCDVEEQGQQCEIINIRLTLFRFPEVNILSADARLNGHFSDRNIFLDSESSDSVTDCISLHEFHPVS